MESKGIGLIDNESKGRRQEYERTRTLGPKGTTVRLGWPRAEERS